MRKITCPGCGQSDEGFSLVQPVMVSTEIDAYGEQTAATDFGAEGGFRSLVCSSCGKSWRTTRYIPVEIRVS